MFVRHARFIAAKGHEAGLAVNLRQGMDGIPAKSASAFRRQLPDGRVEFITVALWSSPEEWQRFLATNPPFMVKLKEPGFVDLYEAESYELVHVKLEDQKELDEIRAIRIDGKR